MENWERKFILQDLGKDGPFPFSVAKKVKHSKGSFYQNGIPGEKNHSNNALIFVVNIMLEWNSGMAVKASLKEFQLKRPFYLRFFFQTLPYCYQFSSGEQCISSQGIRLHLTCPI